MWFVLKNPVIDLIFAIWGFVFVLQGIIVFSASPVFGGVLLIAGTVLALTGIISHLFVNKKE